MKKAIVLLSGGLDSTTCLAYAKANQFECYAISFNYGQKQIAELNAAKKISKKYDVHHTIFDIGIHQFGGSALTDARIEIPDYQDTQDIPNTYVPARNTVFLSLALAYAETINAKDIFIGVSAIDYSGYPDCRPEFISAFQYMANLATKFGVEEGGITIHTPLIHLSKAQTILLGKELDVDYADTISCYRANEIGEACGSCDSCTLRKKGFLESKEQDVTRYLRP